jgi:3-mercaptopyruvate sulfurtransferase SseA
MILRAFWYKLIVLVGVGVAVLLLPQTLNADSSKYPHFAQQTLPENVTPTFIGVEQLVADIKAGVKPVIIDVRTAEEYREAHILGAVSAPLEEFKDYLKSIPRDRPVVLY